MKTKIKNFLQDYLLFPMHILAHPFDGYEDMQRYKKGKLRVAIFYIILFMYFRIYQFVNESFIINTNNPLDLNSLQQIFSVLLIVFLFTVGNWSVTTLMNGKGTYRDILMMTGYSLAPVVLLGFPAVFLSNYLTLNELAFYQLLMFVAYFCTGFMLFMGVLNIHHYGLFKTILAFIATMVSISVMMFVGLLFFDLIQQFIAFIVSIYEEINLRF